MDINQEHYEKLRAQQRESVLHNEGCAVAPQQEAKYKKECNRLVDQTYRAESLVRAISDTLTGNLNNQAGSLPAPEPPFQYNAASVIGCLERMSTKLKESNDNLEVLLKTARDYLGDEIGMIG